MDKFENRWWFRIICYYSGGLVIQAIIFINLIGFGIGLLSTLNKAKIIYFESNIFALVFCEVGLFALISGLNTIRKEMKKGSEVSVPLV